MVGLPPWLDPALLLLEEVCSTQPKDVGETRDPPPLTNTDLLTTYQNQAKALRQQRMTTLQNLVQYVFDYNPVPGESLAKKWGDKQELSTMSAVDELAFVGKVEKEVGPLQQLKGLDGLAKEVIRLVKATMEA